MRAYSILSFYYVYCIISTHVVIFWVAAIYVYVLIVILFKAIFTIQNLLHSSYMSSPASSEGRLV